MNVFIEPVFVSCGTLLGWQKRAHRLFGVKAEVFSLGDSDQATLENQVIPRSQVRGAVPSYFLNHYLHIVQRAQPVLSTRPYRSPFLQDRDTEHNVSDVSNSHRLL